MEERAEEQELLPVKSRDSLVPDELNHHSAAVEKLLLKDLTSSHPQMPLPGNTKTSFEVTMDETSQAPPTGTQELGGQQNDNNFPTPDGEPIKFWSIDSIHYPGLEPDTPIEALPAFEYGPQLPEGHIRILMLAPRPEGDSQARGEQDWLLFCDHLSKWDKAAPEALANFTALSYTWGNPAKTHKIRCNGKSLAVTETVWDALANIGELYEQPRLWIDALCINQDNFSERKEQVTMMRDIYRAARNTLVWLPAGKGASKENLDKIDKAFDSMVMLGEMWRIPEFREMVLQDKITFDTLDHMKYGDRQLAVPWDNRDGMKLLFQQSWFERMWICQEVAVSEKTMFFDGIHFGPWEVLADSAEVSHHLGGLNNYMEWSMGEVLSDETLVENVLRLESFRKRVHEKAHMGVLELLRATANFQSTEPLDRVFALLGLITDERDRHIVTSFLDYNAPPYLLYLNVTINHIIQHGTLDFLHLVAPVHHDPAGKWLSIVPNLAASNNRKRGIGRFKSRDEWTYQATLDTKPGLRIDDVEVPDPDQLIAVADRNEISLDGYILDSVTGISDMLDSAGMSMTSMLTWFQVAIFGRCTGGYVGQYIPGGVMKRHLDYLASRGKITKQLPENADEQEAGKTTEDAGQPARKDKMPDNLDPELLQLLENSNLVSANDKEAPAAQQDNADPPSTSKNKTTALTTKSPPHAKESGIGSAPYPDGESTYGSAFLRTLILNRDPRDLTRRTKPNKEFAKTYFEPWSKLLLFDDGQHSSQIFVRNWYAEHSHSSEKPTIAFAKWIEGCQLGRRMIRTAKGWIGSAPDNVEDGDLVCLLRGGEVPFLLRRVTTEEGKSGGEKRYQFFGAVYVHGVMEGEGMQMGLENERFVFT
ncbi:hypothetical protein OQA88_8954 [Cercophora sp. LCS_1]